MPRQSTGGLRRCAALLLACQATVPTAAFHVGLDRRAARSHAHRSMGLYEEDIDWDADLFGQIGASDPRPRAAGGGPQDKGDGGEARDDDPWDLGPPPSAASETATSASEAAGDDDWDLGPRPTAQDEVMSMREQMKNAWEKDDGAQEEGKPTADWMPRFRPGPDDDEPWFTG